ncbi:MAG TPA: PAS domain S-box protein [Candidatus Acidoferrum sp.]
MGSTKAPNLTAENLAPPAVWHDHDHHGHVVQFYTDDSFLLDALSRFVGTALGAGDAAVVIATKAHRQGLAERLKSRGLDIPAITKSGRYTALDASETLAKFFIDDQLDSALFTEIIGGTIERATAAAEGESPRVVAFGEMVALLWQRQLLQAAVQLEKMWNALSQTHSFSLRCAYPMGGFAQQGHGEPFREICAEHSVVIPDEHYSALITGDERLRTVALLQQQAQALDSERGLRQSEERFRHLVESVQEYAIFMLDVDGRVSSWNIGAERIKRYTASEIIGKHFSCFYPPEDIASRKPQMELEVATAVGRFEDEGWRLRKDGTRFWANVIITALRDSSGQLIGFSKVTRDITERMQTLEALNAAKRQLELEVAERKDAQEKLRESEASLRRLSTHLLRTQDEERRHLGRELHDTVGQYLAVLKMGLDALNSGPRPANPAAERQLAECLALADQSIREVRTMSYLLYPPMLEEMGLKTAIPWYIEGFAKRSGIETSLDISRNFRRVPRDIELSLFRVLQESLTNVHRHSESRVANVRLAIEDGFVRLDVSDQGKGMKSSAAQAKPDAGVTHGVGLRSMDERVRHVGGRLELVSSAQGTTVSAIVPCGN